MTSSATAYTPIVDGKLAVNGVAEPPSRHCHPTSSMAAPLIDGVASVEDQGLANSEIAYVGSGRERLRLTTQGPTRLFSLGGEPFEEQIVMWWNFIGRTHEEIVDYREQWNAGRDRFGAAPGTRPTDGVAAAGPERLLAPPMPAMRLKSRSRQR